MNAIFGKAVRPVFLLLFFSTGLSLSGCSGEADSPRPNIIYIITDQQAHDAMSCAGNDLLQTPSMDLLASRGIRFEQAYCAFPLCVPSRAAMFTGHMPSESGIYVNTRPVEGEELPFETLGSVLSGSGYKTHYIGKWHLTIPRKDTLKHGFMGIDYLGAHGNDAAHTAKAVEFLQQEHEEPFFLVVSLVNPHDCCQLARKEDLSDFEGKIPPLPPAELLPDLPGNFDIPENEPDFIRSWQARNSERIYRSHFWDEQDFREYQWGYYRLVEKVDSLVGKVLETFDQSAYQENTTLIFSSDHGDGSSRHRWNQKWSAYDESARVPFIVAGKGVERQGETDGRLVSSGLDLFPTICELAGIQPPEGLRGKSIVPLLTGDPDISWRDYVVTELSFGNWVDRYHLDTFPKARMVRTPEFKYVAFEQGELREQLIHMSNDPGEMKNLAVDPAYRGVLLQHRSHLREWIQYTGDSFRFGLIDPYGELDKALVQMEKSLEWFGDRIASPRSMEDGEVRLVPSRDWTSGFYPGILWMLYDYTGADLWKEVAHNFSMTLEQEKYNGGTHDMGLKLFCSLGNGYQLTGDSTYREILLQGAKTLTGRYNPTVGSIRSWDFNKKEWEYPVIIDNMMNLELLFWATKETGDSSYYDIAISHSENTMRDHYRPDHSSYHVISYDTLRGDIEKRNTHQGDSHESAWSRGQAWGLYGFTMAFRETGEKKFLDHARRIASFLLDHPNLPADLIPYWDYDVPGTDSVPRDASAAAVTASALIELSEYCPGEKLKYLMAAEQILHSLASDNYRIQGDYPHPFLLDHSTGSYPKSSEVDCPIIYADYYFIESLLRWRKTDSSLFTFSAQKKRNLKYH